MAGAFDFLFFELLEVRNPESLSLSTFPMIDSATSFFVSLGDIKSYYSDSIFLLTSDYLSISVYSVNSQLKHA